MSEHVHCWHPRNELLGSEMIPVKWWECCTYECDEIRRTDPKEAVDA